MMLLVRHCATCIINSFSASNNMGYAFLLILLVNKDTEACRNWMKLPKNHTDGKASRVHRLYQVIHMHEMFSL